MLQLVEQAMRADDETTATQLHVLLTSCGVRKRLTWARQHLDEFLQTGFEDIIWTDETTVQLETHRRNSYCKKGEPAVLKPCAKHLVKVHVWAGVSHRGTTPIAIFEGTMNAKLYVKILRAALLPFIKDVYPESHKLMQDNDPKHTATMTADFSEKEGVNWWKTPPESPDLNPIENPWHEMKEYMRREIKPTTKQQLINGIRIFWRQVTDEKCQKYISHLRKVIPRVIEVEGAATGY